MPNVAVFPLQGDDGPDVRGGSGDILLVHATETDRKGTWSSRAELGHGLARLWLPVLCPVQAAGLGESLQGSSEPGGLCLSVGHGGKLDKLLVVPFSSGDGINSLQPLPGCGR